MLSSQIDQVISYLEKSKHYENITSIVFLHAIKEQVQQLEKEVKELKEQLIIKKY